MDADDIPTLIAAVMWFAGGWVLGAGEVLMSVILIAGGFAWDCAGRVVRERKR